MLYKDLILQVTLSGLSPGQIHTTITTYWIIQSIRQNENKNKQISLDGSSQSMVRGVPLVRIYNNCVLHVAKNGERGLTWLRICRLCRKMGQYRGLE